jgi:hypothetical protein
MFSACKPTASALGRRSRRLDVIFRIDIVGPFDGRKGNRVFNGLRGFHERAQVEGSRERTLERDHGAFLVNNRGSSDLESLF